MPNESVTGSSLPSMTWTGNLRLPHLAVSHMRLSLAASPLLAFTLSLFIIPGAQSETLDHNMFACDYDLDVAACNDMVRYPNDTGGISRGYLLALRAKVRMETAGLAEAASDLAELQKIEPASPLLPELREMLATLAEPQRDLKVGCILEGDPPRQRLEACSKLIDGNIGTDRESIAYHASRAEAAMDLGDLQQAQADIAQIQQSAPTSIDAAVTTIELAAIKGDYQTALAMSQKAIADHAEPAMTYMLWQAQFSYLLGNHSMAIRQFMAAIHADFQSPLPHYWSSLLRLEDHEDATVDFHRIVTDVGPRTYLGKIGLFQLDQMSPQALIDAANAFPASLRQKRLCIAYFIIGHKAWLAHDKNAAKQAFLNALQTNQPRMIEFEASKELLQKLDIN
jgi:tetratricopeptide (TPR) repeat protein